MTNKPLKKFIVAACAALALAACSDASVTSPGETSQVDTGGGGTGGGGTGGTGGQTGTCPAGTTAVTSVGNNTTCALSGTLLSNLTLTSGVIYQLNGRIDVGADVGGDGTKTGGQSVTLTVQPGVRVFGAGTSDFIVVNRGSRIIADGTATLPIVFTSRQDILGQATATSRSQWGGLVMLGRAPINSCPGPGGLANCEAQVEGTTAFFGGALPNDSSGTLRYVQIKHGGIEITPNNELQNLTLAGVGAGTTIDYIQSHNSSDDGIEWFGGTVNLKHVVITGASDDSLDWASGWVGRIQYALVVQATDEGDHMVEADNLPTDNAKLPLTAPTVANFTFIGQPNAPHTAGILQRVGVGGTMVNGIVKGSPQCLDIDDASTLLTTLTYRSVTLDCPVTYTVDTNVTDAQVATVFTGGTNNVVGATSLTGQYFPGPQELSRTPFNASTLSGFFDNTTYVGAFSSTETASNNWAFGWTVSLFAPPTCPTGTTNIGTLLGQNRCEVRGVYTADLNLTAGNLYQLGGRVDIGIDVGGDGTKTGGDPSNLTIDAGVTIFGSGTSDFMVVNRGSKIFANGTPTAPVTFTALQDVNNTAAATARGLWGGLVVLGRAPINSCPGPGGLANCEAQVEGTTAFFGGAIANDSSGRLKYMQIKHGGIEITPNNELQNLTIAGVGAGTEIDYLQSHNSSDDGIEWFGGTVNLKHIVVTGASDDSLDWSAGWNGNMQFALVVQAADEGDHMLELDNLPTDHAKLPLTAPKFSNFTLVGQPNAPHTAAILERVGVGGTFVNGVVIGSPQCLDIDDASTLLSGLVHNSVLLDCPIAFTVDTNVTDVQVAAVFNAGTNNSTATPDTLTSTFINGPTETARAAVNPTTLGTFFSAANYIGAVSGASDTWWQGWSCGLGGPTPAC